MRVDAYKVMHWMNVRKMTAAQVAEASGVEPERFAASLTGAGDDEWPDSMAAAVARTLVIEPEKLAASGRRDLTVITRTARELHGTRRPIQRDGIHFYNYYTMAAPPGAVAPVILDILCPADRVPALNNGHMEPAITVNLGPGDIHGRWGEELDEATWQVMRANRDDDAWIVGDSYVEPSFCPHSYSLVSDAPARIVSYTGHSNLASLVEDVNDWAERPAQELVEWLGDHGPDGLTPYRLAVELLARRGHTPESAAAMLGMSGEKLAAALEEGSDGVLRELGSALGLDHRMLLRPERRHDRVGKTYRDVAECRRDARRFRGYRATSLACAPHLPDLTGLYLRVDGDEGEDLRELAETHYLVTGGEVTLHWTAADGRAASARLDADGTAWVAPFVAHRWTGDGALIKLGSGRHLSYLDLYELTNTYSAAATLRRARRDGRGWGYDS
ncbi:histidine kinase [Nonomuraea sp. SMC257]|uniref:Histidine kinase n=1 Tax=Nonomuraea montanisoli TaxID=2741721 RepID=A0A7Y6M554_9ACTN|nr:histidine kinase [Nonomuraea montanisoli]NUW35463.1 histidine kinase [Nonomuraea montanisoli]